MIRINYQEKDNKITNFLIEGHAMYDIVGKDIVCSATSSIVITSINAMISINESSIKTNIEDSKIEITNLTKDDITNKLLLNMLNMLTELEKDYPENIKIRKEEK